MPKSIRVSLKEIVEQINRAEKELSGAQTKAKNDLVKRRLAVKIRNLNKVKTSVKEICKGYLIIVPTK